MWLSPNTRTVARISAGDGDGHAWADALHEPAHRGVGEPDAAVGNGGAENASYVVQSVHADLARAAGEFLKHGGAGAQGEGERSSDIARSQLDRLFDEERAVRGRRRPLAHDRLEDSDRAPAAVDDHSPGGRLDDEMPACRARDGRLLSDPARVPVRAAGQLDVQPPASSAENGEDGSLARERSPCVHPTEMRRLSSRL